MTIAACYPCLEGVVFGADSTVTMAGQGETNRYNFCQKVFEFGEKGSATGIVVWGMGSLGTVSYRTLVAEVADEAGRQNFCSLDEVASLWAKTFWDVYSQTLKSALDKAREITDKADKNRTEEDKKQLASLMENCSGGFCIGGRWGENRRPKAYEILFDPRLTAEPDITGLTIGISKFWGCPNLIDRLKYGIDPALFYSIVGSAKWKGTEDDLFELVKTNILHPPSDLPIREAIDLIYTKIYTTIKAMKFSQFAPICGGPIEIAVVTTDRPFRWVCHKDLSKAISEGHY